MHLSSGHERLSPSSVHKSMRLVEANFIFGRLEEGFGAIFVVLDGLMSLLSSRISHPSVLVQT